MTEHEIIWLQPWCDGCQAHSNSGEGRLWCQDDVWGPCEECGNKPVKFVRADGGLASAAARPAVHEPEKP